MENKIIARKLRLLSQLMELHEANPFKVRSLSNAAYKVDKSSLDIGLLNPDELAGIDGIGKSTAQKIVELTETGTIAEIEKLLAGTPPGLIELLSVKGLGPKKVRTIWKELGIESAGELYYACNENRLVEAKGFGRKTQDDILKLLEFVMRNEGKFLYAAALPFAERFESRLLAGSGVLKVSPTGEFRRRGEVLTSLEFLVACRDREELVRSLKGEGLFGEPADGRSANAGFTDGEPVQSPENAEDSWTGITAENLKVLIRFCGEEEFAWRLLTTTGSAAHLEKLRCIADPALYRTAGSEQEIYHALGLDFIEPELREGMEEISWSASRQLPRLIEYDDLKGSLHNHTTYSDGVHSPEEMALQCIRNGYDYLGICDHSRSAFYANGLSEERVRQQHEEIDLLNRKLAPFRIFKGIESDILYDGSLDYPDEILASFDFVVASVHSQLKMTREKATERLIRAIEHPGTTILGHPTGRLLLAREGYQIDHEKVIDACAANGVIIELNANPLRLDLDWRWIPYALSRNVMISINPDAHRVETLADMRFGVYAARKAALGPGNCFNALTAEQVEEWFMQKKKMAKK